MPVPLLILAILGPAAVTPPSQSPPITVTGHQWAPFISPTGEPFRAHTPTDDTLADWFYHVDTDRDGYLTAAEMVADAQRFFAKLDTNHDGQLDPDEVAQYEYEIAPEIQVMSSTKRAPGQPAVVVRDDNPDDDLDPKSLQLHRDGKRDRKKRAEEDDTSLGLDGALQGAARYSLLNIPEPVAAADTNFDRVITLQEFREAALARFALLDTAHRGKISLAQLEAMPHAPSNDRHHHKVDENALDPRIGDPLPTGP